MTLQGHLPGLGSLHPPAHRRGTTGLQARPKNQPFAGCIKAFDVCLAHCLHPLRPSSGFPTSSLMVKPGDLS